MMRICGRRSENMVIDLGMRKVMRFDVVVV